MYALVTTRLGGSAFAFEYKCLAMQELEHLCAARHFARAPNLFNCGQLPMISLPRSSRSRLIAVALMVTSVAACGGGGGDGGIVGPPPVPATPVASVTTTPSSATVFVAYTTQVNATPKDAAGNALSGRAMAWSSSDNNIATVDATGLVKGQAAGTVTVRATSEGQTGSTTITVTPAPVAQVVVSPTSATIKVGESVTLNVTLKDSQGDVLTGRTIQLTRDLTYVTSNGLTITGKAAGSTSVSVISEGVTTTIPITVNP